MLELIIIRSHHHFEIEEIAQIGVENKIEMYFLKRVEVGVEVEVGEEVEQVQQEG